jgi:hypothetical protein
MRVSLFWVLLGIYLLVYVHRPDAIDGDATLAVAVSLIQHGTPDIAALGASEGLLPGLSRMGSFGADGHLYSKKGVTPSLFLLPFVLIAQAAPWLTIRATAMLFNPVVTALTAVVLYSFLVDAKFSPRTAWRTALLYGVATFAISYTRTLFGEPLAALLLLWAVWQLWRRQFFGAGLALALCVGINLSYAVMLALGAIFVIVTLYGDARTQAVSFLQRPFGLKLCAFLLPGLLFGGFLLAYNALRFGSPFTSGYNFAQGEGFNYPAHWGIFGLWLSPYRGILWYNPVLWLALPGSILWWRSQAQPLWKRLSVLIVAFIIAQTLVYAPWWSWHGGIVWGARFLIPVLPLLMLLVAPVLALLASDYPPTLDSIKKRLSTSRFFRWSLAIGVLLLVLLSVLIQFVGSVYDYQHYVGYLYQNYASGQVEGLVSGLTDAVMLNPQLSPIVGHWNRLLSGANLDTALTANGVNGVHLLAALVVLSISAFQRFSISAFQHSALSGQQSATADPSPLHENFTPNSKQSILTPKSPHPLVARESHFVERGLENPAALTPLRLQERGQGGEVKITFLKTMLPILITLIALNLIVAQQQTAPNHLPADYTALHPSDTVVVADAAIGNALLDIENGVRAISMNSPTTPDDPLASGLWQNAQQAGGYLWLITWLPRLHPENWQERELWTHHAFVREIPFLDKRAVLFDMQPTIAAAQTGGWQFGAMQLANYGIFATDDAVRVTFAWQTDAPIPQDYGWFVHLVDARGQIVAQQDRPPQGGYRLTTTWQVGETIEDYLTFPLDDGAVTTGWFLRIGWLDPNTGDRLPLTMLENAPGSNDDNALLLALSPQE